MKKKTLVTLLAVVLVMASLLTVFVACKPKPEPKEFTMTDAIAEITESVRNTYLYGGVPFGWDADMQIAEYAIKTQGRIDVANKDNTKFNFEISKDSEEVINLSADHTYMYATQNDWKRRFKDFQLQQMVEANSFATKDENAETIDLLQLGLTAIFANATDTATKTASGDNLIYELKGNLGSVVEMVKALLGDAGLESISEAATLLANVDIVIKAEISKDGKLVNFNLDLITDIGDLNVGASKFHLSDSCNPTITLPEGRDSFITTNALNFTLKGDVTLKSKGNFNTINDVYKMEYTLRLDYNIFKAMRDSLKTVDGKMTIDPKGLFTDPSNKIYFDLSHVCGVEKHPEQSCNYCKENRESGEVSSQGSFLTLAYAPQDFGSNNINVAINMKQLLPKGLLKELVDLGGMDITSMFTDYLGITIDPLALMINDSNHSAIAGATNMASEFSETLAGLDIKSMLNPNILGIFLNVLDFAKEIQYSDADGLTMGSAQMINLVALLDDSLDFNISGVLSGLLKGSDYCHFGVPTIQYGDETIGSGNMYEDFMIIDESLSEYKVFGFNNAPYSPVKTVEWAKDKIGNVVVEEQTIQNYDADGNALCLSADEAKTLFTKGYAKYSYTTMDGNTGSTHVGIKAVYGLDYSKKGVAQTVTVVTSMTDAGSLSGLLNLVGGFVQGLDLNFAGNYFTTKVIISDVVGDVKLEQKDTVVSKYNKDTVYEFQSTKINPYFTASVTYADGSKKEAQVTPDNLANFFGNYGTPDNGYVSAIADFDMTFNVFGKEIKMPVKVKELTTKTITANVKLGADYRVGTRFYAYKENSGSVNVYSSKISAQMKATVKEGDADGITFKADAFKVNTLENGSFTFNKAGTYTVDLYVTAALVQTYVFNVTDGAAVGKVPGYGFAAKYLGNEITVDTHRTDNRGNGMKSNFVVTAVKDGKNVVLANGTDYEVYEVIAGARTKIEGDAFLNRSYAAGGQRFIIVVKDKANVSDTIKVAMHATDYDNSQIGEMNPVSAWKGYSITGSEILKDANNLVGIKYAAVCADKDAVAGAEFKAEIKIKVDGASEWTTLTAEGFSIGKGISFWGSTTLVPLEGTTFGFSANGKIESGQEDSYFILAGVTSNTVIYEINIYATNYDNVLVATTTNAA